jgi:hypothetical protein
MPRAVPQPIREQIVARRREGESLTAIAQTLQLPYRTVRGLWSRYRRRGQAGLPPDYDRCCKPGPRFAATLYETALALKREHPRWGAPRIRIQMTGCFPETRLPASRTLQEWFRRAGLSVGRSRQPPAKKPRGRVAHEVWQLDAKEQMQLGDGSRSVSFAILDEATGAVLGVALFPPEPVRGGAGGSRPGVAPAPVEGLGTAPATAGG